MVALDQREERSFIARPDRRNQPEVLVSFHALLAEPSRRRQPPDARLDY